jgi:hypothetical protein
MDDDQPRECPFCDRAWGLIGLTVAALIAAAGLDLLTGGRITAALFHPTTQQEAE